MFTLEIDGHPLKLTWDDDHQARAIATKLRRFVPANTTIEVVPIAVAPRARRWPVCVARRRGLNPAEDFIQRVLPKLRNTDTATRVFRGGRLIGWSIESS